MNKRGINTDAIKLVTIKGVFPVKLVTREDLLAFSSMGFMQ